MPAPAEATAATPAGTDPAPPRTGAGRAERRRTVKRIKRRKRRSALREVPILIGIALVIALVLKTFLVQAFVIPSGSMEQTIRIGDRVLVDKFTPWFGYQPQRGDVVVFQDPGHWLDGEPKPAPDPPVVKQVKAFFTFIGLLPAANEQDLIKRVIAVGGDHVRCCDAQGRVTVNGTSVNEPYIDPGNPPSRIPFDITVPPGRVWVMGDHRSDSADSRYHMTEPGQGTVAVKQVVGRAFVIAWPTSHWRTLSDRGAFAGVPKAPPAAPRASGTGPGPTGAVASGAVDGGTPAGGPAASDGPGTVQANIRQGMIPLPTPAELPLVMGVMGLHRVRRRRWRGVRSGCGGPGGRSTIRTWRSRRAGPIGKRRRG
ncbi:signal peptidase I [Streptantibioticus cattleyicolor NRRL 8057 = DSM 46488]|uniref:Signal peptidase I n=1 Tax=Streptantibioticus cattleyicolor (strain ATCC 35852 / DSM 46488 / JCM 4925 / NBRC 14057 / NRRL 8057) TaxID=1003195 RepID=G8WXH4_STREN|nr:signal peptidase I [Streptantibioticus cattleyicolor NRRL 8057 = DSM 46488]